jgi:hypothetical protein
MSGISVPKGAFPPGFRKMRLSKGEDPQLSEKVLREIARIARVAPARYSIMCELLREAALEASRLCRAKRSANALDSVAVRKKLGPVLSAAKDLKAALSDLNDDASIALDAQIDRNRGDLIYGGWDNLRVEAYNCLITDLVRVCETTRDFRYVRGRVGAPSGTKHLVLKIFVGRLYFATAIEGGGIDLKMDRKAERGTLVEVLELIRDQGERIEFIPNPLPWAALEQMLPKKLAKKL